MVNYDTPLNFVWTDFCYLSLSGIMWCSKLGCSHTSNRPAVLYGAYF